jgi:hypothetical protein
LPLPLLEIVEEDEDDEELELELELPDEDELDPEDEDPEEDELEEELLERLRALSLVDPLTDFEAVPLLLDISGRALTSSVFLLVGEAVVDGFGGGSFFLIGFGLSFNFSRVTFEFWSRIFENKSEL